MGFLGLYWSYFVSSIPRPPVYRIVLMQLALTLMIAGGLLLHSPVASYSALLGGLAQALPNAYFIWRAFKYSGARSASLVVQSFYQGEAWKFVLTAIFFAVIFARVEPLNLYALFGTFIAMQFSHVLSIKLVKL